MKSIVIEESKKRLKLNQTQRSILAGMLLGDAHLETQDNGRTYRLKIEHSSMQKEYVDWLYSKFRDFTGTGPVMKVKKAGNRKYQSYGFATYSLGLFRFYAQQFYSQGQKVIPKLPMLRRFLNPLTLAVWFMDEGSFKSKRHKTFIIHTLAYSKKDLELVKEALKEKYGIQVALHKQYKRWRIYIPSDSADRFREIVAPYVLSSMEYKLGNIKPKK